MSKQRIGEPRDELKAALIETKQTCPVLSIALLAKITERSTGEIEGFLYEAKRAQSWTDCFFVYKFLRRGRHPFPRNLSRVVQRRISRLDKLSAQHENIGGSATLIGATKFTPGTLYRYRDQPLSAHQISAASGKSVGSVYRVVREGDCQPDDDITTAIDAIGTKRRRRRAAEYLYRDQPLSIASIAEAVNRPYAAVYHRIKTCQHTPGDDVTAAVDGARQDA